MVPTRTGISKPSHSLLARSPGETPFQKHLVPPFSPNAPRAFSSVGGISESRLLTTTRIALKTTFFTFFSDYAQFVF